MKSIHILFVILLASGFMACKNDNTSVQEEQHQQVQADSANSPASSSAPSGSAATAENSVAPVTGGHDYTFLTDQILLYKAAFGGKNGEQLYKDEWIDLASDGTYKAGKLKEQTHTGKWGYNHDQRILQLIPDDNNFLRSEWKVMHNEQMMVWVGTQTYGNNNTQIQLVRSANLP